ncbi:MAG: hypothetical protein ACMVP2_20150 [Imperialibacter sp.]|uniref:hypothetical protein n=1 Tax=Imperialibacter sp. TaxID=2038411 RepID=UPI003A8715BA
MKTILIPSDFAKDSVAVAQEAVHVVEGDVRLLFIHAFSMPDSEQDLLYGNYRKRDRKYISDEFMREVEDLKDVLSYKIKHIVVDFFYGTTPMLLENYLDYYEVSLIAYSSKRKPGRLSVNSIDFDSIIKRSSRMSVDIDSFENLRSILTPFA